MRRIARLVGLLFVVILLVGCSSRSSLFPAHPTMEEALGEVLDQQVTIAYREPFEEKRALVLFRTEIHPALSPTLLEAAGVGRWRMTEAVGLGDSLMRVGSLTFERANLGHVERKIGTVTHHSAETHLVFGELLDPAITWVELTLEREGAEPIRATVKDGVWLAKLPPEEWEGKAAGWSCFPTPQRTPLPLS